jgi:hypothetical protein
VTAREAIPLALEMVRSCSYPGGRDLERLRDLARGELDDTIEDPVLAAAVRDAAANELFDGMRDSAEERRGDWMRDQAKDQA